MVLRLELAAAVRLILFEPLFRWGTKKGAGGCLPLFLWIGVFVARTLKASSQSSAVTGRAAETV